MKCFSTPYGATAPGDSDAAENSRALESLLSAGKLFVAACHDSLPGDTLEEGLPIPGRDELEPIPFLPHNNDPASEFCTGCAGLE